MLVVREVLQEVSRDTNNDSGASPYHEVGGTGEALRGEVESGSHFFQVVNIWLKMREGVPRKSRDVRGKMMILL
jgi:hypothetical protein